MFKHLFEFNEPYAYSDGSTGGAQRVVAPPYFWTKGPKKCFGETAPQSPLSKGLDDRPLPPPPPPYLKVWIRHWLTELM